VVVQLPGHRDLRTSTLFTIIFGMELLHTSVDMCQSVLLARVLIVGLVRVVQLPGRRDVRTSTLLTIICAVIATVHCDY